MKKLLLLPLLVVFMLVGCSPVENNARDTAAALGGLLVNAQQQNLQACQSNPQQPVCVTINKAIAAHGALVTAAEAYCGWSTSNPPFDPNTKCVPVKGAEDALKTAINNAQPFITALKEVIK